MLLANKVDLINDVHVGFQIGALVQKVGVKFNRLTWVYVFDGELNTDMCDSLFSWLITSATNNKMDDFVAVVQKEVERDFDREETNLSFSETVYRHPKVYYREGEFKSTEEDQRQYLWEIHSLVEKEIQDDQDSDWEAVDDANDTKDSETHVRKGSVFIKYGRNGRPSRRMLWISQDGKWLRWGTMMNTPTKSYKVSDVERVLFGQQSTLFRECIRKEHTDRKYEKKSLSLLINSKTKRSVDLIAVSDRDFELWRSFFERLVAANKLAKKNKRHSFAPHATSIDSTFLDESLRRFANFRRRTSASVSRLYGSS